MIPGTDGAGSDGGSPLGFRVGDLVWVTFKDPRTKVVGLVATGAIVSLYHHPPGEVRSVDVPVVQTLGGVRMPVRPEYLALVPAGKAPPDMDWMGTIADAARPRD